MKGINVCVDMKAKEQAVHTSEHEADSKVNIL